MSDRVDRRRRSNVRQYSAEDQALNQISKEADARLQAKRAARAEARGIRLREIEKQQKEAEERQDKLQGLSSGDYGKSRQLSGSRRNSTDSTESMESNRDRDRDLRAENRDLEEKYKQAMMTSATLDNEKQTLVFQLELLKDQIEEMEEAHIELKREHKDRCRELEMKKRAYTELDAEVKMLKEHMVLKDKLIEESGFVIMSTEDGEYKLEKNESMPNGPVPTGGSVLLSPDSIALLKDAGEGSLGTATQHHLRSSPVHETKPNREGKTANTEPESLESQGSNVLPQEGDVNEKNRKNDIVGKEGGEHGDIPNDSGSVLAPEEKLVEESLSEADSNRNQPAGDTDIECRVDQIDGNNDKEIDFDSSSEVVETKVDQVDSNTVVDDNDIDNKSQDKIEVAEVEGQGETGSQAYSPVLDLNLIKDSSDGISRDDSGIFSPDDVAAPHSGFSNEKLDVKIIEPEHDTDEEGDEFFDAVSTPSPFLNNKPETQYEFKDVESEENLPEETKESENELKGKVVGTEDVQDKESGVKVDNEESLSQTQVPPNNAEEDSDKKLEVTSKEVGESEEAEKQPQPESTAGTIDNPKSDSNESKASGDDTNTGRDEVNIEAEFGSEEVENMKEGDNENKPDGSIVGADVDCKEEGSEIEKDDSVEKETDKLSTSSIDGDLPTTDIAENDVNEDNCQKEENHVMAPAEDGLGEQEDGDEFKDADSFEAGKETLNSEISNMATSNNSDSVLTNEKASEAANQHSDPDKELEVRDSCSAEDKEGTSVDADVHDEFETCQDNAVVAGGEVKGEEVLVSSDIPAGHDQEDDTQGAKDTKGESLGSSVDDIIKEANETYNQNDSTVETEGKDAGTLDSEKNLAGDTDVDNGESKHDDSLTTEGSSVDAVVKEIVDNAGKDEMDSGASCSELNFEEQDKTDSTDTTEAKTEETYVTEDEPSQKFKDEKSDNIQGTVGEGTDCQKGEMSDDKTDLGAGIPCTDTSAKELDTTNDADQREDSVKDGSALTCQKDADESSEDKQVKQNIEENGKSIEDEKPCDSEEKTEKAEKQTTSDSGNLNEDNEDGLKETDSSVVGKSQTENVGSKEDTREQTDFTKFESRDLVDKVEEKKKSEYSGDSDDEVFVKDEASKEDGVKKLEQEDQIPDSPQDTPEKKSGSGMKSEGELSEDDVLDEAYSFDDIDEVLEDVAEQKLGTDAKTEGPSEIQDAPKIVIEGPSTDSVDNGENGGYDSSKKTSSSDSISTSSGKEVVIDPISDDAMSTGSGAESGSAHPPPSPKEGKKGKKFGKFFKNIFK